MQPKTIWISCCWRTYIAHSSDYITMTALLRSVSTEIIWKFSTRYTHGVLKLKSAWQHTTRYASSIRSGRQRMGDYVLKQKWPKDPFFGRKVFISCKKWKVAANGLLFCEPRRKTFHLGLCWAPRTPCPWEGDKVARKLIFSKTIFLAKICSPASLKTVQFCWTWARLLSKLFSTNLLTRILMFFPIVGE